MHNGEVHDVRDDIFQSIAHKTVYAEILADDYGLLSGLEFARNWGSSLGVTTETLLKPGAELEPGDIILSLNGAPKAIAMAEDRMIGCMAKSSGIATATRRFVDAAGDDLKIVSGAWKKMPFELKQMIRQGAEIAGAQSRISLQKFIYLDKNYTAMFGGITATLKAVEHLSEFVKVIQICGQHANIEREAERALEGNANIIFVDTGDIGDLVAVSDTLAKTGRRNSVDIAFAGGVTLEMIPELKTLDVDLVDIGRAIVDAPLLDMKMRISSDATPIAPPDSV